MTDPRAVLETLLGPTGDVRLPSLTREELVVLGDRPALACADDQLWWAGLDDASRTEVHDSARRGLVARNLPRPVDGTDDLIATEEVRAVLETRHHPSWLLIVREPAAGTDASIVSSGIDPDDEGTAAVMISARVAGVHFNRLTSSAMAFDSIVEWLLLGRSHVRDRPDQAQLARTIEVILPRRPGVRDVVVDRRVVLIGVGTEWRMSELDTSGMTQQHQPTEAVALRSWLVGAVSDRKDAVVSFRWQGLRCPRLHRCRLRSPKLSTEPPRAIEFPSAPSRNLLFSRPVWWEESAGAHFRTRSGSAN